MSLPIIPLNNQPNTPNKVDVFLNDVRPYAQSISEMIGGYAKNKKKAELGKQLAIQAGRPELEKIVPFLPDEKVADFYNNFLKVEQDNQLLNSIYGSRNGQSFTSQQGQNTNQSAAPSQGNSIQDQGIQPQQRPQGQVQQQQGGFQPLSPEQETDLAIRKPTAFNAYQKLKNEHIKEQEKIETKESLQETLNSMAKTLSDGNLGYDLSGLTEQGREDRQYFDSLGVQLESIAKDMVSKGVLAKDRFKYLLDNLPSAGKTDASNRGALKAWGKTLGIHIDGISAPQEVKLKKVPEGTEITLDVMKELVKKTGGDEAKVKKLAKQLGYEV